MPGIDCAHLAMDTEEGVEVVWNEVQFSERKNFKSQEEKIQIVFESLTQLEHPNIVKFHRYWTDTHNDKPRVCCFVFVCVQNLGLIFIPATFSCDTGNIYYRIHVLRVTETVPKAD